MTPRSLSHRAPLLALVVAWGVGLAIGHGAWGAHLPHGLWAGIAFVTLVFAWLARRHTAIWALALFLAVAAAGVLRIGQVRERLPGRDMLPPREARLKLRVERTFAPRAEAAARATGLARVLGTEAHLAELTGQKIYFSANWPADLPPPVRGTEFTALGLLATVPFQAGQNDFAGFLADAGVNQSFSRARLETTPVAAGVTGAWGRFCAAADSRLEAILRIGLAENPAEAKLYVAMMLGQKQELDEHHRELFIQSGTMHLFAISGLHIAGIAVAVNTLLLLVRLPSRGRFVVSTLLLWAYVEITGRDPSAVRSFWMVTCLFGAQQWRAPGNSLAALITSALVVLVIDPHQLFSAGFQMSYGIVAALLLYGVPLQELWLEKWRPWSYLPKENWGRWRHWCHGFGEWSLGLIALGLASTLVSLPATLNFFNLITPGAFFTNLVLIPLSTPVLFAGVCALIAGGLGLAPLAMLFNHAAALLLAVMAWLVERVVEVPGVAWPAGYTQAWLGAAVLALMPALLALGYVRGWRRREGGYWLPYALLVLVLVVGVRTLTNPAP
jgi:competence protein ComEC